MKTDEPSVLHIDYIEIWYNIKSVHIYRKKVVGKYYNYPNKKFDTLTRVVNDPIKYIYIYINKST